MSQKGFIGSQKRFGRLFIIGLVIAVILLILKPKKSSAIIGGSNVSLASVTSFNAASSPISTSKYYALKENWKAVAKMETAGFTSNLFLKANNPWGMKQPKVRQTTSIGPYVSTGSADAFGWAKYSDFRDAWQDIVLWMDYTKFPTGPLSIADHVREMQLRGYDDNPDYLNLVLAWMNK